MRKKEKYTLKVKQVVDNAEGWISTRDVSALVKLTTMEASYYLRILVLQSLIERNKVYRNTDTTTIYRTLKKGEVEQDNQ